MTSGLRTEQTSAGSRALVFRLLERFCSEYELRLTAGDPHGHAGRVESPSGKCWYFVGARFDLNNQGAAEIAKDKAYSLKFLAEAGIPHPASCFIQASTLNAETSIPEHLQKFLKQNAYPLYLKPNAGQEGVDVVRINAEDQLQASLTDLTARHDQLLLQEAVAGQELRVVVLDLEVLCVVERLPPQVNGDGIRSITHLMSDLPGFDSKDDRIDPELTRQGLTFESVPANGQEITLLPVANLSSGGSARIVARDLSPEIAAIACKAVQALGLRFAGVDLIIPEGDNRQEAAILLEVNAAPGLSHLHRQGAQEAKLVEDIYFRIFETALLEK